MAELQFGKVRGQYLLIKGTTPRAATGRVTFTPIEPDEIVDGPKVTTREKTVAVFDANGWLHLDEVPVQYVQLAVGRWEVSFREAPGLTVKAFQFDVTPTGDEEYIDLPLLTPIVPTPAIKPVVNEFLYQQTILARDAAVEAQEAAEQAALDAVVPTQTVMDARIDARRGAAGGIAPLGSDSKLPEAQVPDRLSAPALSSTIDAAVTVGVSPKANAADVYTKTAADAAVTTKTLPIAARSVASTKRQAPRELSSPESTTPSFTGLIGMLPDGRRKVATGSGFSAAQIGVTEDGVTFTWGENFGSANLATGLITTPGGEVLVAVKARDNATPGTLRRSTGWDPAIADATSWATVLTASKNGAHMDGRWCLTERSIAPLNSPGAGALYVCEYDGNRAWASVDDGITWTQIFDLQTVRPGATHVHSIAYDRWDDRVWISIGDTAYAGIYYVDRDKIDGLNTPWILLTGSNTAAWQVTTIVPLAAAVVFLSDATDSAVYSVARTGQRGYAALRNVADLPGNGLIGAHAYQAADNLPAYLTFYQSGSGQTPRVIATIDGEHFSTVFTDTATVTTGPGIHSIVGPDLDGRVWAVRNLSGSGALFKLSTSAPTSGVPTTRQVLAGSGLSGGGPLSADVTLSAVNSSAAARRGVVAHAGPEELFDSTSAALVDGTLYLVKVVAESDAASAARTVRVYQEGAATSLTSWVAAVFDASGNQLGATSSSDAGSAQSHRNFGVGSFGLSKGQEYYVGLLFKGTTGPTIARGAASARVRMGLSGANLLYGVGGTGLTGMPASITPSSVANLDIALWAALL
ncbi:hypothetical protein [Microbacterium sp. BH-3-3-3]|uniref:hypothetical protein n=1 Tax=Microbacterium sp. BH-3-3-3 TaxID=1906742 RepID=UPI0011A6412C|nr:hypothetical protein [Microbacterium sp. BH-3-3-3]